MSSWYLGSWLIGWRSLICSKFSKKIELPMLGIYMVGGGAVRMLWTYTHRVIQYVLSGNIGDRQGLSRRSNSLRTIKIGNPRCWTFTSTYMYLVLSWTYLIPPAYDLRVHKILASRAVSVYTSYHNLHENEFMPAAANEHKLLSTKMEISCFWFPFNSMLPPGCKARDHIARSFNIGLLYST